MKIKLVFRITGRVLFVEAAAMLLPLLVSILYGQNDAHAFLISIGVTAGAGLLMIMLTRGDRQKNLQAREGFAIVAATWIMLSLFGALPFMISGAIPNLGDALFETISGFTTTGATILANIEILPRGILFWRSFTHWVGGMGVLILFLALLPSMGERSIQLLRAESPGPSPSKLVPRIGATAKILYTIYLVLTVMEIIILKFAGMPFFDSVVHAMGTAGTGGFSIKNASIGAYGNTAAEIVIGVFMMLFGVNFAIYYQMLKKEYGKVMRNTELLTYLGIVGVSVALITANIRPMYDKLGQALNHAFFQVSSIITTTGYATTDYNYWPDFSKMIIVTLMIVGACAGSTGGGVKVMRVVILFKAIAREIRKIIHPRAVNIVRVDGQALGEDVLASCMQFFSAYVCILIGGTLVVSLDNTGFTTSFTAVLSCISNVGPGLEMVGPAGNFESFSYLSKAVMSLCMLIGRLEIFPILVMLAPSSWKKA